MQNNPVPITFKSCSRDAELCAAFLLCYAVRTLLRISPPDMSADASLEYYYLSIDRFCLLRKRKLLEGLASVLMKQVRPFLRMAKPNFWRKRARVESA